MKYSRQRGAVAPFVAILLFVIVVSVSLVVDLGHIHSVKGQLQRAVDAAALAGAQHIPNEAKAIAVAEATARENTVDRQTLADLLDNDPDDHTDLNVELGSWDEEALGSAAVDRWDDEGTPVDAIKVRARRDVEHIFFFFLDSTEVVADAIALQTYEKLTIPIAIVTCIPTGDDSVISPAENICDLSYIELRGGAADNAGWTGLTITPAGPQSAAMFMDPDTRLCSLQLFNQVVYGNPEYVGLESATVDKTGCSIADNETHFTSIDANSCTGLNPVTCGLGGEFSAMSEDPLDTDPLPRWYHKDELLELTTMDNLLVAGTGEEDPYVPTQQEIDDKVYTPGGTIFDVRMIDLHNASLGGDFTAYNTKYPDHVVIDNMQDDRYSNYISVKTTGSGQAMEEIVFADVIDDAGYPRIDITNGVTNITDLLIDLTSDRDTKEFLSGAMGDYPILDGSVSGVEASGKTVLLTVPIIYAYECDGAGGINFAKGGFYVGTANILLTRVWDASKSDGYDAGADSVTVTAAESYLNNTLCRAKLDLIDPGLTGLFGNDDRDYKLPGLSSGQLRTGAGYAAGFAGKTFEGMLQSPDIAEEAEAGLIKVYLVE